MFLSVLYVCLHMYKTDFHLIYFYFLKLPLAYKLDYISINYIYKLLINLLFISLKFPYTYFTNIFCIYQLFYILLIKVVFYILFEYFFLHLQSSQVCGGAWLGYFMNVHQLIYPDHVYPKIWYPLITLSLSIFFMLLLLM